MLQALIFGLLGGSAVFFGAVFGIFIPINKQIIAGIMAFGTGY